MTDPPITQWIRGAQARDEASEHGLWNHYFSRVVRLARSRMFALQASVYDEEDAAVSALRSVFRGIQGERFPELHDRNNLWRILVVVTNRKLRAQWRRETAGRRSPQTADPDAEPVSLEEIIGREPTPEFVAEVMDETEAWLERLADRTLQKILVMRLDGFTNDEIAAQLDCTTRTVERKMERIRLIWHVGEDE